jgi:hypothetical protein
MRTVAAMIKALEGLPPMSPVQVGLVGPDGGRGVRMPGAASEAPVAPMIEADQTGEAVAAQPPAEAPRGPEGEGEEPAPPTTGGARRADRA